jgi:hypothetical protein
MITYPITNNQSFSFGATAKFLQNIKEGAQYNKTCKGLLNVVPTVQGIAYKRMGLVGLAIRGTELEILNNLGITGDTPCRIFPFFPIEPLNYILIFIPGKVIAYPIYPQEHLADIENNPGFLKLYILDTPFSGEDIEKMDVNIGKSDVIICTTDQIPKVIHLDKAADLWQLAIHDFSFSVAPFLRQNPDRDNKCNATALTGDGVTITFTKPTLQDGHVGSTWLFYGPQSYTSLWEADKDLVENQGYCYYGDNVYKKTGGADKTGNRPVIHSTYGEISSDGAIYWQFVNNGYGSAILRKRNSDTEGEFDVIVPLPIQMTEPIAHANAVWRWNEPAFSNVRGWPSGSVYHGESLIFLGTNRRKVNLTFHDTVTNLSGTRVAYDSEDGMVTDSTLFGSARNDFSNFHIDNPDKNNGFKYTLETKGDCRLLWGISNGKDLVVGTTDGIFSIEVITDNKIQLGDFIKDSPSQKVQAIFSSTILFYVGNSENSLKTITSNNMDGSRENSSVSNRAPELYRDIVKLASVESDANHTVALLRDGTMTCLYFDASQKVDVSGVYKLSLDSSLKILDIHSINIPKNVGRNDSLPQPIGEGAMLLVCAIDTSNYWKGKWPIVVGYLNINQPHYKMDYVEHENHHHYQDQYYVVEHDGVFTRVHEFAYKYKAEIVLHKQGFLNPGHPYGDITKGSKVRHISMNTYNTAVAPTINGYGPGGMNIIGPTDSLGNPQAASEVEVIYHYKENTTNLAPLTISSYDLRSLCIINMDIMVDVAEQQ